MRLLRCGWRGRRAHSHGRAEASIIGDAHTPVLECFVSLRDTREGVLDARIERRVGIFMKSVRVKAFGEPVIGTFDVARLRIATEIGT